MMKFLAACAVIFAIAPNALACRIGRAANPAQLERYSSIYLVEVTGLHLTGYERSRLIDSGSIVLPPAPAPELERVKSIVNYTQPFRVNALVERVVKGPAHPTISAQLGGCFVKMPTLKTRGLIFIESGTGDALGIWEDRPEAYANALRALGLAPADEP
jgi:hypothetical protein